MAENDEAPWRKVARALGQLRGKIQQPWASSVHPLELRRAILQELEGEVVPVGDDRRVFPYTHLRIRLLVENDSERAVLEASFEHGVDFATDVREHLEGQGCEVADLEVEVEVTSMRTELFGERRFVIERRRARRPTEVVRRPVVELTVTQGKADCRVYTLDRDRIYIGRLREVTDETGRLRRANDVAFADDDEINRTVSREHARIERRDGELRLIDERSAGGTQIFRDGRPIAVSSRDRRGVLLRPGDLLYFGRAAVRFAVRDDLSPPLPDAD